MKKWINKKGKNKKEWNDFPSQADRQIRDRKYKGEAQLEHEKLKRKNELKSMEAMLKKAISEIKNK